MLIHFKVMDDPNQFSKMLLGMMKLPAPLSAIAGCIVPCVMKSKVSEKGSSIVGVTQRYTYFAQHSAMITSSELEYEP